MWRQLPVLTKAKQHKKRYFWIWVENTSYLNLDILVDWYLQIDKKKFYSTHYQQSNTDLVSTICLQPETKAKVGIIVLTLPCPESDISEADLDPWQAGRLSQVILARRKGRMPPDRYFAKISKLSAQTGWDYPYCQFFSATKPPWTLHNLTNVNLGEQINVHKC